VIRYFRTLHGKPLGSTTITTLFTANCLDLVPRLVVAKNNGPLTYPEYMAKAPSLPSFTTKIYQRSHLELGDWVGHVDTKRRLPFRMG
jgi:hypothetical protein